MNRRFFLETTLIFLLILLLSSFAFIQFSNSQFSAGQSGSSRNNDDDGTQRFFSWMAQRGHSIRVTDSVISPDETAVIFMIAPQEQLSFAEVEQLNQWIFGGGTLFIIQDQNRTSRLLNRFNIKSRRLLWPRSTVELNLPTLNWPLVGELSLQSRRRFEVPCGEVAVHLGSCREAHLATFSWGSGQVILLSTLYPMSNAGLQNSANARLMQNLVNLVIQPNQAILISETPPGGWRALAQSIPGWALVAAAILVVSYLIWQNRPFQNPVGQAAITPEPETLVTTNAFINHLATAQKELDPTRNVREHYWRQVKRRYANRHGFDPNQSDEQFLDRLRQVEEEDVMGRIIYIMTTMVKQQVDDLEFMHWTAVSLDELADL